MITVKKKLLKNSGFTLVEVMVAAVILAVSVIAILGMITDSYGWLRQNQDRNTANALLERKAEEVTSMSFNYINDPLPSLTEQGITVSCSVNSLSSISKKVTLTAAKGSRQMGKVNVVVYMYGGL